jgi:N,N'-diacetylbacillosaminyl-diphospho-undecaprenol alpha-1,3-N-acetylgalactosaminyltransferase
MPLLKAARAAGHEVICVCGDGMDAEFHIARLRSVGYEVRRLPGLEQDGLSLPLLKRQADTIGEIVDELRPDILHSFTHRANVAAFLALRKRVGVRFIPNVTGAGRLFDECPSLRDRLARVVLLQAYRQMGRRCECIFFQNEDDVAEIGGFMRLPRARLRLTGGSGLDPAEVGGERLDNSGELRRRLQHEHGIDPDKRMFLFPSRALKSKGVQEFYETAARYLELFDDAVFVHAGEPDDGPHGMNQAALIAMQRPGLHFIGFQRDIYSLINVAAVVVLPSFYREGVPRALIEALYFGKLVLTTDGPGCREVVIDGWNGRLVQARSVQSLLAAMVASQTMDTIEVTRNSRRLFDRKFHADRVTAVYLEQYGRLSGHLNGAEGRGG